MKLTPKQDEAQSLITGPATHVMLFGGSRSGKTALHTRNVIFRALKAPGSRHAILRFRFNHIKASIVLDTFPKIMSLAFPGVKYRLDKSDWYAELNDSQIWFGGLDDKERTEKILGQEYATIYLNECSQIPWGSQQMAQTRLAQKVDQVVDKFRKPLKLRMFYDCNPPSKAHWSYRLFIEKLDPESRKALPNPSEYAHFQINPVDNRDNLPAGYIENTLAGLSARLRKRFLAGEFADATPNALWRDEDIDRWRCESHPDLVRVVVAVDPSGADDTDNVDNDEIGIVVAGLGVDGNAYVLEDLTVKVGPAAWGRIATSAYDRHQADIVVGEVNFGGAMVKHVIQTARPNTPFRMLTASRGKAVRAEPISALYETGKVRHVGEFRQLEDELCAFSTAGYTGERSPNRADALIWAISSLFPGLTKPEPRKAAREEHRTPTTWMG